MGAVNNGQYQEAIRIQQHFGNMVFTRHFSSSSKRTVGKKFCFKVNHTQFFQGLLNFYLFIYLFQFSHSSIECHPTLLLID